MTRFNHIRQAVKGNANNRTWAVSEPDRWERVKLQVTCQGVVLESDLTPIQDVATVKHEMESMLHTILTERATPKLIIRRKVA